MNGYKNDRMILVDVCKWLISHDMKAAADHMNAGFKYHTWTVDGMLRVDVIRDCFKLMDPSGLMFRQLQCDVTTYMSFIPDYEAHID